MARYELNNSVNGVEIYFESKPDDETRDKLKALRFRWHNTKKMWYAKQNADTLALAEELCGRTTGKIAANTAAKKADATIAKTSSTIVTKKVDCIMNGRCCYSNTVKGFLSETEGNFIKIMKAAFNDEYVLSLGSSQEHAWRDCFEVLQEQLPIFEEDVEGAFHIVFEYALPYESGRRPDVLLVSNEHVLILEFKMKGSVEEADVDQVRAYARDIREYHFESRDKTVIPFLVLTKGSGIDTFISKEYGEVICCTKERLGVNLSDAIFDPVDKFEPSSCNIERWMDSKYEPLPTIVESARRFMDKAELPNIRRVNSTCIPQTLENLRKLTRYAKKNKKHTIAFVTGVPGAGKTYLGLQYVYDIREADGKVNSVYLSGNGPLVKVLTDALNSNVFVKDLHKVENEFLRNGSPDFDSNVIVFDEGQRAWDVEQMKAKKRGDFSEPDVMIQLAEECLDWCVLLILVGEGQEIYKGENSGISQWNDALDNGDLEWEAVFPSKLNDVFDRQNKVVGIDYDVFDLTVSLRSHLAGDVSTFVNLLIDGNITAAANLSKQIYDAGYSMYYTRDLNVAKTYCRDRYEGCLNKRYGMMTSSKAYDLKKYGIGPAFRPDVASWFNADIDNYGSSCALRIAISEFDCQGLEIDMPIIGWGQDLQWSGKSWKPNAAEGTDDYDYRINSYRVLLTRGRDGFIIYVPDGLDNVALAFKKSGIKEIE